ncbi:MAG: methyltransferase domain-containing protein [bacterium]|nr:methyltransferase domain-containing protein [bacterium]
MKNNYLETARDVYKEAALHPQVGLCCTTAPVWKMPDLEIPDIMLEMNYGCGTTVHPRDLVNNPTILYVGIGGGMELFQFSYFSRKRNGVIGVDAVHEMIEKCTENLLEAEAGNPWFKKEFLDIREGNAMALPVEDASIDVAAQNCLFNIFHEEDLTAALREMYRVLKPNGRLVLSDPVCGQEMPENLKNDPRLRALCLSGAIPLDDYLKRITDIGFGTVEVRAKRPYRVLDPLHYDTSQLIVIESVEICAVKDRMPNDGPCIFTGKTAIYFGEDNFFDDRNGHTLPQNQPVAICDKTAAALGALGRSDIYISGSTYHYDGGGCC